MRESVRAFPAITEQEFSHACSALEQRSSDKISDTNWLSVRWTGEELLIKERRRRACKNGKRGVPSDDNDAHTDELIETGIEDCIVRDSVVPSVESVELLIADFSITLSPTYSVPVLWFVCRYGKDDKSLSLEQVYEWLVPEHSLASVHEFGVMGGISMAVGQVFGNVLSGADSLLSTTLSQIGRPSSYIHATHKVPFQLSNPTPPLRRNILYCGWD
ncbi:hypothetical protein AYO20_02114 [Fonsecaea nubica]|uniref:Uncharacterized protein n=1 Tax=Fonsecaea nubica TaxID=856822 RepID=A0A178DBG8_9EURO|nr:hypothetical protein AYO20_02114 [Fonsecaea nubica]OAL38465.1 hypothetical protein AYO20_02114 [Fonsecaea nubica]